MILTLKNTDTGKIGSRLVQLREEGGVVALGRVLTLIIITSGRRSVEEAIDAANEASREHPCRVIVVEPGSATAASRLDAEIRIGADAGASEVVVLRPRGPGREETDTLVSALLLPDAPIVVWWPQRPPQVAMNLTRLGSIAQRRISNVLGTGNAAKRLAELAHSYAPGDTDLSWARTTLWRALAASMLDDPPYERVVEATVFGSKQHPSTLLLAGWLAEALKLTVTVRHQPGSAAIDGLDFVRASGTISMRRPDGGSVLTMTAPDRPVQQVSMPLRSVGDCLMEDLRRLDADEVYRRALTRGLPKVRVA